MRCNCKMCKGSFQWSLRDVALGKTYHFSTFFDLVAFVNKRLVK